MRTQKTQFDDDDDRVIVNMNVEGAPWYDKQVRESQKRESEAERKAKVKMYGERMTNSEARRYTFYAVLAGLTIALAFAAVYAIVILFMTKVWFR